MNTSPFGPNQTPIWGEIYPSSETVFELWEQSALRAKQAGIKHWAVVADGIKAISLQGKVDADGLETLTTEIRDEAVEWAR